jgi:hypothetical protein
MLIPQNGPTRTERIVSSSANSAYGLQFPTGFFLQRFPFLSLRQETRGWEQPNLYKKIFGTLAAAS